MTPTINWNAFMDLEKDFIDLKNSCIDLNWHASANKNSPLLLFELT